MLLAIDTGGTKTLLASFSEDGHIEREHKFPTPSSSEEYLRVLAAELAKFAHTAPRAVVAATPGMHSDGRITWAGHRLGWRDVPLADAIAGVLPDTPIYLENDANLGGVGEMRRLAQLPRVGLYVTISTDIGTGVITHGTIDPSLPYSEGGHAVLEYNGRLQRWGDFASGSVIYDTHKTYARDITDPAIWDDIAERISRGLLAQIPLLCPDTIVIGGSIGTYFAQYQARLNAIIDTHLPRHIPRPAFVEAKDAEKAVVYGCYFYGIDKLAD